MRATPRLGPSLTTAAIAARIAAATAAGVSPSMTISSTAAMSGSSALSTAPLKVGQYASLVDAGTFLYFEPTLEPERAMPPGNGAMASGTARIAFAAASAAAYRIFGEAGRRLADELAVHDRQAPVTFFSQSLGDLPAVAEIAQGIAELERLLACKPRVTGGSGAGEHALRYPGLQLLLQFGRGDREQQHAHAGPAVQRCTGCELVVDRRLAPAADHRCGEAGHRLRRLARPTRALGGDHDGGRAHAKGFGERVVHPHAVCDQPWHGTSSNGSGR